MRKQLAIKMLSYRRIQRVLADDPTAVNSTTALKNAALEFQSRIAVLEALDVPEISATKPKTSQKNKAFDAVTDLLLPVCDGLLLYANHLPDAVLAGRVPRTLTDLRDGNEVTQLSRFWSVLNAAKGVPAADFLPYGVSAADLAAIETMLTNLNGMVGSPRSLIDARMVKRDLQEEAFQLMDAFLKETMDRAVRNRQANFANFVSAYFLARKHHDMPSQPKEASDAIVPKEVLGVPTTTELQHQLAFMDVPATNGVH